MNVLRLCAAGIASLLVMVTLSTRVAGHEDTSGTMRAADPSSGCGTSTAGPVDAEPGSLVIDGTERTWLLHLPTAHDGTTPLPLVIMLHGLGGDSGEMRSLTASGLPDDAGFVVVAPLGSGLISRWMWDLDDTEYDLSPANPDIAFIDALIDRLAATLCLDLARVHVTGHSNGAIGASALGCVLEDRIAAIAPVAAVTDFGEDCVLERPVPALAIHGAADPYVLLEGGWGPGLESFMLEDFVPFIDQPIADWPGFALPIRERMANIAARNGCDSQPTRAAGVANMERLDWPCPAGAEVGLVIVEGAGHSWPVTPVDAGALIWDFFSRQALPSHR